MLKPQVFFAAVHDLFFKKGAQIQIGNCAVFINKIGDSFKLSSELMLLENLWDETTLQTLKSKGCITLADGFQFTRKNDKICFEQLLFMRFSYATARKKLPLFIKEFYEYKKVFSSFNPKREPPTLSTV